MQLQPSDALPKILLARYYGNSLPRFLSPDPVGGNTGDTQSWNRYTYVRNNPVKLVDPLGLYWAPGTPMPTIPGDPNGCTMCTVEFSEFSEEDKDAGLEAMQEAVDDPEKAAQLDVVPKKKGWWIFSYTVYELTNGDADWSGDANPNAQLIDSAIDTDTVIRVDITNKRSQRLIDVDGALTDPSRFTRDNRITITINPELVSQATVRGTLDNRSVVNLAVPLGIAVIHELGHSYAFYQLGEFGGPGYHSTVSEDQSVIWENLARARQTPWSYRIGH